MIRPLLLSLILSQFLGLDCGERKNNAKRFEGIDGGYEGYVFREECIMPRDNCFTRCWNRQASHACNGCCFDQGFLCDTQQPHSFEQCDGAK